MAYERAHRLDDRQLEEVDDERHGLEWEWNVPGKQTRTECLAAMYLAALPRPVGEPGRCRLIAPKLGFGDFRALALRDVLSRLGEQSALRAATLVAADPQVARRVGVPGPQATTLAGADVQVVGRVGAIDGTGAHAGRGMWGAAERRAVTLYRRAMAAGTVALETPAVTAALNAIGSGGPLDPHVCRKMENILGVRLDRVRLHTGAVAQEAAQAANAKAFTVGEDIFFPDYDPHSAECEQTLLHELVHCRQWWQGRIGPSAVGVAVSETSHPLEQEAESVVAGAFQGTAGAHDRSGRAYLSAVDASSVAPATPMVAAVALNPTAAPPPTSTVPATRLSGVAAIPMSDTAAMSGSPASSMPAAPGPALVPTIVARGSTPHLILRKASIGAGGKQAVVVEPESGPVRNPTAPDVATVKTADPTVSMTITPGAARAMERPHYGEAKVRVTGAGPETYRYMVMVPTALRQHEDAAWIFSSLTPVPAEIVRQLTSAVQEQAGLSDADAEANPDVAAFWLPRTSDGATLYFSATGMYVVVALARHPDGLSLWKPFVVRPHERNEFEKGVIRGIYNTGALFASGAAAMARGVGAGRVSEYLIKDIQQTLQKEVENYPAKVQTIDEAITGVGPFLSYTAGVLGEQVPTLITMIIGGGLGRLVAGAVAKTGAMYMGKSLGEHEATQLALQASATWKLRGTFVGGFGANAELQTGEIYQRLLEIKGLDESQKAVWVALTGGVVGGFLETVVPFSIWGLGRPFTVALAKQIAARPELASQVTRAAGVTLAAGKVVAGVAGAGTVEGLTEVAQEQVGGLAERLFNEKYSFLSPETLATDKENFARGFLGGSTIHGAVVVGKAVTSTPRDTRTTAAPTQTAALGDPTVLDTVRNQDGAYHVSPTGRQAMNQQASSPQGDVLRYNAAGGYYEPASTKRSSSIRPGVEVIGYNSDTHKITFDGGLEMDARHVTATSANDDFVVVDIHADPRTSENTGRFRRIGAAVHDVVTLSLSAVTFFAPIAGGSPPRSSIPAHAKSRPIFRLQFEGEAGRRDIYIVDPARPEDRSGHYAGFVLFEIDSSDSHNAIKVRAMSDGVKKTGLSQDLFVAAIAQLPRGQRKDIPAKQQPTMTLTGKAPQAWHLVNIKGRKLWLHLTQHHLNILQELLTGRWFHSFELAAFYEEIWKSRNPGPMPRGYGRELVRSIRHALAHAALEPDGRSGTIYAGDIVEKRERSGSRVRVLYRFQLPQADRPTSQKPRRELPKLENQTYRIDGREVAVRLRPVDHKVVTLLLRNSEAKGQTSPRRSFVAISKLEALLREEINLSSHGPAPTEVDKYVKRLAWTLRNAGLGTIQVHSKFGVRIVNRTNTKAERPIVINGQEVFVELTPSDFELLQQLVNGTSLPESVVAKYYGSDWKNPKVLRPSVRVRAVLMRLNGALQRAKPNVGRIVRVETQHGIEPRYRFESEAEPDGELPTWVPAIAGGSPSEGEELPPIEQSEHPVELQSLRIRNRDDQEIGLKIDPVGTGQSGPGRVNLYTEIPWQLIGHVTFRIEQSGGEDTLDITNMGVVPQFQRLGLSKVLLEQVVCAHPVAKIKARLFDTNQKRFYDRLTDDLRGRLNVPNGKYFRDPDPEQFLQRGITKEELQRAALNALGRIRLFRVVQELGFGVLVENESGFETLDDGGLGRIPALVVRRSEPSATGTAGPDLR